MTLHVTTHAIIRYQERVRPVSDDEARQALSTPAIQIAAQFTGSAQAYVRLPTGQRVLVKDNAVITVQPREHYKKMIHRRGLGRFGKSQRHQQEYDHARHPID